MRRSAKRSRRRRSSLPTVHDRASALLAELEKHNLPAIAAVVILLVLNHFGLVADLLDTLVRGHLADANEIYLHQAKIHAGENLTLLAALEAGLKVIESSSAGFSLIVDVNVQVGNLLSVVAELTARAFWVSVVAASALIGTEVVLDGASYAAQLLLTTTLVILVMHCVFRRVWRWVSLISGQISEILLLITFLVYIGLPLAVFSASSISDAITKPVAEKAQQHFKATHDDFAHGLHTHVSTVIDEYKKDGSGVQSKSRSLAGAVARHAIAVIFDAFIFPGSLLLLVTWLGRIIIRHTMKIDVLLRDWSKQERPQKN
ncbi:hypothetical protein [Kordiimonas sp.]|uniref:hypothetical protein n=1 Tax=Kordiimonas sp. TaxID=1970157 RepID=UPI003A8EDB3D